MKGGSSMKHFYIGVLVALVTMAISVGGAYIVHNHNQDKRVSKIIDKNLLSRITKLEQEIKILKANSWF